MITVIVFLSVFAILVFVHEWGHFFAAKKQGIAVEEFGFGFPPRLLSRMWRGTLYSLNSIPLGGFVKIKGEEGDHTDEPDSFSGKPVWRRMIVVVAGVTMNIVLGWALLSAGFMSGFPQVLDGVDSSAHVRDRQLFVVDVRANSPAFRAGFEGGDEILEIAGTRVVTVDEVRTAVEPRAGQAIPVVVRRDGERRDISVTPELVPEAGRVALGVALEELGVVSYGIGGALLRGGEATFVILREIIISLYQLARDAVMGLGVRVELSGPVGIAVLTGKMASRGFSYLMQFAALLSLNLAVLNLLPIPALDGGRFVFLCIEALRRRPVSQQVENVMHRAGFALLLSLVVFVTYKDIIRYFFS